MIREIIAYTYDNNVIEQEGNMSNRRRTIDAIIHTIATAHRTSIIVGNIIIGFRRDRKVVKHLVTVDVNVPSFGFTLYKCLAYIFSSDVGDYDYALETYFNDEYCYEELYDWYFTDNHKSDIRYDPFCVGYSHCFKKPNIMINHLYWN